MLHLGSPVVFLLVFNMSFARRSHRQRAVGT
jgi:hypothetical protein